LSPTMSNILADPYEAAEASLRKKEARLMAELEAVRKGLAAIALAREASDMPISAALIPPAPSEKFRGMGLGEALAKQLADSDHVEKTIKQLWTAIYAAGFRITSKNPEGAANWALRKREKEKGDVFLVGNGKWGMADWYSPGQMQRFREARNNASGRNHDEHVENTKRGIANAMNSRLRHWGPKRKITGDHMALAFAAYQAGADSKLALAKAGNMSWPTFAFYWQKFEMENWRPGDEFPPARRETPKFNQEILFEDMWPREKALANGHDKKNGPQLSLRPAE
jgi:hypothetical protein